MSVQAMKKRWTDLEIAILNEMYRNGSREKEIAQRLNRPVYSVSKKIDMLGLRQYREERKVARQNHKRRPSAFKPHFLKIALDDSQWDASENDFVKLMGRKDIDEEVLDRQAKDDLADRMIFELGQYGKNVSKIVQPVVKA